MGKWFEEQPEEFYSNEFEKLVEHWQHCMKQEGDYFEKHDVETKYTFWAIFYVLFQFSTLSGSKDANVEALVSEHPLYKHSP
jgi:hypothetical protein